MSDAIENPSILASWWRRMAYTPLRDWTRGRLTARLDLKALVARCELPPELRDVVYKTARGARLWRLERIDAAQELIDHFTDGLQAGQTPAQLRESFGDWKVAARLIGRAKRRTRPLWLRIAWGITKTAAVLLAVFAILSALLVIRYRTVRPIGDTSFTDALNERARGVPEADRAWPLYEKALHMLLEAGPIPSTGLQTYSLETSEIQWDELANYVNGHQEMIATLREAASKPRLGAFFRRPREPTQSGLVHFRKSGTRIDVDDYPDGANHFRPSERYLSLEYWPPIFHRQIIELLRADALVALQENKADRAIEDIKAMIRTAELCVDGFPVVSAYQTRLEVLQAALLTIGDLIAHNAETFSDQQLQDLSQLVEALSDQKLTVDLSTQNRVWNEFLTQYYAADGFLTRDGLRRHVMGHGRTPGIDELERSPQWGNRAVGTAAAAIGVAAVIRLNPLLSFGDQFFKEIDVCIQLPYWKRNSTSPADLIIRSKSRGGIGDSFYMQPAWTLYPWLLDDLGRWRETVLQQRDAVLTAIALELYHRNHGDWPKTLDALVPEFLTEIPVDRFDGKPLKYVLRDGRPELYSIGTDRNDDGGMTPENEDARKYGVHTWRPPDDVKEYLAKDPTRGGDWILWPTPEPRKTTDDAARD